MARLMCDGTRENLARFLWIGLFILAAASVRTRAVWESDERQQQGVNTNIDNLIEINFYWLL